LKVFAAILERYKFVVECMVSASSTASVEAVKEGFQHGIIFLIRPSPYINVHPYFFILFIFLLLTILITLALRLCPLLAVVATLAPRDTAPLTSS